MQEDTIIYRIKNGKLYQKGKLVDLPDGYYVIKDQRNIKTNDCWKGWVRALAEHTGNSNVKEFEKEIKSIIFADSEIKTSELSNQELKEGLNRLYIWALTELGFKLPELPQIKF